MKATKLLIVFVTLLMVGTAFYGIIASDTPLGHSSQSGNVTSDVANSNAIKPGGTAIVLPSPYESFTDSFNPFSSSIYPNGIQSLIYEPMFQIDPLNGTTIPWLATSYAWSNGDLTLTVHLRQNVTFSNGMKFNASDVVFTFNLMKKYPALDSYSVWDYITSVSEVNQYEVQFTYKTPNVPSFYYLNLVLIVPKQIWQNVSNPVTYTNPKPVGTGPFVLTSVSSSEIELSANAHYWQPNEPHLSHIVYYAYTSNNAADLALEDGQVSWGGLFIPGLQKLYVSKDPANYGYYFGYETPVAEQMNNMRFPLNQTFFREAMGFAINRTKLYMQGEYGYETPALGLSLMESQSSVLNSTNLKLANYLSQYNVSLAKKILSEHGYTWNSKGQLVEPNGTLVPTMTIMTPAGWTDWDADISIISQEEAAIGIKLTVVTPVYSTLYNDMQTGNYWIIQYSNTEWGPNPYYGFYGQYYDGGNVTPIGQTATTDWERFNSSTDGFSTYLQEYSKTTNVNDQNVLINKMASIIMKNDPVVTTVNAAIWYEYNNKTIGGFPTANNNYWVGAPWQNPALEVVALHLFDRADQKPSVTVTPSKTPISNYIYGIIAAVVIIAAVAMSYVYINKNKKEKKFNK